MSRAIFLTREVGKDRQSGELAANLWANRALRVQVSTTGIDLGRAVGEDPPLDLEPRFPGYRIFGAMREELKRVYFPRTPDLRGVWTSDMVPSEPGFAEIERRGHRAIDRFTGIGGPVWYSTLLSGICTFTVRYPASAERQVRLFLRMLGDGWIHLGAHRSTSGSVHVLKMEDITVAEAKTWEAYASAPQTTLAPRYAEPARQLVELYALDQVDPEELKNLLRPLIFERIPVGAVLAILQLSVRAGRRGIWWHQLQHLPERLPVEQGQLDILFHRELVARIRPLPDMTAVREYLEEILKAARSAAAEEKVAVV